MPYNITRARRPMRPLPVPVGFSAMDMINLP
jgi:hypothetical protein